MKNERIEFPGSQGEPLAGRLQQGEGEPRGWALFAHCFTCSKDTLAAVHIARALVAAGYGVLRFDFTGLGGSGGDFANTDFSSNVDDLVAAADWLRREHGAPALLIGHSLGGAAVLAAAHRIKDCRAVATIGAPFEPGHVQALFGDKVAEIRRHGEATVTLAGRPFTIRQSMLDDLDQQRQDERIRSLRRPLLILHSPRDEVVPIDNASGIFRAALHPKSFVSLDDADHLLSREPDARYAAGIIAVWAARYLGGAAVAAAAEAGTETPAARDVRVRETGSGAYTVEVTAGGHRWRADEPRDVGGDDAGPNPYQMLLAALGACTAMTLRMYAQRKQWPLRRATVTLHHEKIHARDCADCETREGRIDRIERRLELEGDLDAAQRRRLAEIADKCPVHRTLQGEVRIVARD